MMYCLSASAVVYSANRFNSASVAGASVDKLSELKTSDYFFVLFDLSALIDYTAVIFKTEYFKSLQNTVRCISAASLPVQIFYAKQPFSFLTACSEKTAYGGAERAKVQRTGRCGSKSSCIHEMSVYPIRKNNRAVFL